MFSLQDKVALITGASQGIGRATALALATAGAKVAVAARNTEKLAALVTEIESTGGTALAVPMDVADAAQVIPIEQDVVRVESGIDTAQMSHTLHQEGGANQQHDRKRHLSHD